MATHKLLFTCLLMQGLTCAAVDTFDPDIAKPESLSAPVETSPVLKNKSLFEKTVLIAKSIGAGAATLLCGACAIRNARHTVSNLMSTNKRDSLACLAFVTACLFAGLSTFETGRDAIRALYEGNA